MTRNLPAATLDLTVRSYVSQALTYLVHHWHYSPSSSLLQVEARDTSNGDTAGAELQLEVKSGRPRGQIPVQVPPHSGDPDQPWRGSRVVFQLESLPTEHLWLLCFDADWCFPSV